MKSVDTRKTNESIALATVSLFDAVDRFFMANPSGARHIFAADRQNRLNVAWAMPCTILTSIHHKSDTRRMDRIYRFWSQALKTLYKMQV